MNEHVNWSDISYLAVGNEKQVQVHEVLIKNDIMGILSWYNPILVGTIPIDIDIESSDLDIICEAYDFDRFKQLLDTSFLQLDDYTCSVRIVDGISRITANFICDGWPIEIFGQPIPVVKQNGYRHMLIESKILEILGLEAKNRIVKYKKQGLKTEPAFAKLLKLEGNPYQAILELEELDEKELKNILKEVIVN